MEHALSRLEMLVGQGALDQLAKARVAVFGLGGVGGYAVEALARCGIGALDLTDHDTISMSNLNRQILATCSSVGRLKVELARERIREINPKCEVRTHQTFFLPETADQFDFQNYDYVIDAVDTVTAKLLLASMAQETNTPIISAMGTGNKLHPELLEVADIYQTSVCPLARIMRKECRKRGIRSLKVVYSREEPQIPTAVADAGAEMKTVTEPDRTESIFGQKRAVPGSAVFVPATAGLILAAEVVRDLICRNAIQ